MNKDFWKNFSTAPGIDALKMKQEIQAGIYEEIKDLTPDELVAYFNRAGEKARRNLHAPEALMVKEETTPYKPKNRRRKK